MNNTSLTPLAELKLETIQTLNNYSERGILEKKNVELLTKLIRNADNSEEVLAISALGTTYKRTGFHFDKRLEKMGDEIKYFKKNEKLSFVSDEKAITHKLIIGDNYDSLLNLMIEYSGGVDIIYLDPPYGKDSMGNFADTNYDNAITRDNLLSMLYPRLVLAKRLLAENGVIYCSVDDKNQAYFKCLFDDVFSESNFIGLITQNKGNAQNDAANMQKNSDYVLVYCKNKKYEVIDKKKKEAPILREGNRIRKKCFKDEQGNLYYKKSSSLTTGNAPTLKERYKLGWTLYYNPKTKDKIAIQDYDLELAKTSNDENVVYTTNQDYINKGYITIRPPKKFGKLGRWVCDKDTFNSKKDEYIITDDLSVVQKVIVNKDETIIENGDIYYIKDSLTKNTKSIWDYSSSAGSIQLTDIINDKVFENPKNVKMLEKLIEIYREKENLTVLDFFAGSGTMGQAVLEFNKNNTEDRKCKFILCTNNEITDINPNGIAYDVTSKRLKRVMTGKCYDGTNNFPWIEKNEPYGDNLEVLEIESVSSSEKAPGKIAFDVIDEKLYGKHFDNIRDKIEWICNNFDKTQKLVETDSQWLDRTNKKAK